jgi:hypothetical protein
MKKSDIVNGFTIFVASAGLITFILNMINDRFLLGDFMVYYKAAERLVSGESVYLISFHSGSGYYKYSPATLFFFIPYTLFSFKTAEIIHFFILGFCYWYTFLIIRKLLHDYFYRNNTINELWLISISFSCILIHFARELFVGNLNIILLMLCCLSIRYFLREKNLQGGILTGIMILVKPYLLILLLPMVLRKKWKALTGLWMTIIGGLLLPFVYPGPQKCIALYGDWIKIMQIHDGGFPGKTSLDYFIRVLFPSWPEWGGLFILVVICGLIILFILYNLHAENIMINRPDIARMNFTFEWFLIPALLPNLIKTDWVLLVFSAPLITLIIFNIAIHKRYWWIPLLVVLLFFYSANSDDLLGREFSHQILESGLMGLSNFLLLIVALVMFFKLRKSTT